MKKYLVCYYFVSKDSNGFSNIVVNCDKNENIYTEEEIIKIQTELCKAFNYMGAAIQNIIQLEA